MQKSHAHLCRLETLGYGGKRQKPEGKQRQKKDDWKRRISRTGLSFKQITTAVATSALEVTSGKRGGGSYVRWPDPGSLKSFTPVSRLLLRA